MILERYVFLENVFFSAFKKQRVKDRLISFTVSKDAFLAMLGSDLQTEDCPD